MVKSVMLAVFAALVAISAGESVYCRLLHRAFQEASSMKLVEDLDVNITVPVPVIGDVELGASHLDIGHLKMDGCVASVDEHGFFHVSISNLDVQLNKVVWRYTQSSWPHMADSGVAVGNASVSFKVVLDMAKDVDESFEFQLDTLDANLGAQQHPWMTSIGVNAAEFIRPLVSKVMQHEVKRILDGSLAIVRQQGGCVFLQDALRVLDFTKFAFTSYQPSTVHVPVVGFVNISVNSTSIDPPKTMQCKQVGFNGNLLSAHIYDVPFGASFTWAYQKLGFGESFWHNQGSGSTSVKGGAMVHIDLLKPADTFLKIDLPILELSLKADSDAWMYDALTFVMVPLVREAIQLFGGEFLAFEIRKCLEDPNCPRSDLMLAENKVVHKSVPVLNRLPGSSVVV